MIEIDKHIPPPIPREGKGRAPIYPFATMQVGDSFESDNRSVASAGWRYGRDNGVKFSTRKQPNGRYRTWRIE